MALDLRGGNSILGLMGHIQEQGELGRQEGNKRGLAGLLSKGMTANPMQQREMLAKGMAIDPEGAQKVAGLFKQQNDDLLDQFGKASLAYSQSGDPALGRQWAQMGVQAGMLPPEAAERDFANPQDLEGSKRAAQAFAQALANSGGVPAGLQEFQHMTQGLSPEDQQKARRIHLGLDGRASNAGFQQVKFTGADGRERIGVFNGRTGQIDMPDGTSYNPQTGEIAPTGGGQQYGAGAPSPQVGAPQMGGDFLSSVQSIVAPLGGRVTSTTGGQHNPGSLHPGGGAVDIGMGQESPEQQEQILAALRANPNLIVRDERTRPPGQAVWDGPHLHVERAQDGAQGGANPFVGRRKEDETFATESAKAEAELRYAEQRAQADADREALVTAARERAEAQSDFLTEMPKVVEQVDQTIALLDKALTHPGRAAATGTSSLLDPRNFVPGTDARDFRVLMDQLGGRAFLEAFESLKGGGQITEIEGRKATEAMARLNTAQSEREFEVALRELRDIAVRAKDRVMQRASSFGQQPAGNDDRRRALLDKY